MIATLKNSLCDQEEDFKRLLCKTLFIMKGKFYKTIEYCTLNLPNNNIFPTSIFHIRSWDFCKAMLRQKFWTKMNCIKVSFQNYKNTDKRKVAFAKVQKNLFLLIFRWLSFVRNKSCTSTLSFKREFCSPWNITLLYI